MRGDCNSASIARSGSFGGVRLCRLMTCAFVRRRSSTTAHGRVAKVRVAGSNPVVRSTPPSARPTRAERTAHAKAEKQGTDGVPDRDSVIELEQAGDSAKAAAEADTGLSGDARESVLAAHLAICKLKAGA